MLKSTQQTFPNSSLSTITILYYYPVTIQCKRQRFMFCRNAICSICCVFGYSSHPSAVKKHNRTKLVPSTLKRQYQQPNWLSNFPTKYPKMSSPVRAKVTWATTLNYTSATLNHIVPVEPDSAVLLMACFLCVLFLFPLSSPFPITDSIDLGALAQPASVPH